MGLTNLPSAGRYDRGLADAAQWQRSAHLGWKAWHGGGQTQGFAVSKTVGQALQARLLIDSIFDTHGIASLVVAAGDFNAQADEVCFKAVCGSVEETGNPAHAGRMMIPCENNIPDSARYSLIHLGRGRMLDHIVVSRSLLGYFRGAEIRSEALPDESGAFRTDTRFPESDHAPVVAEFDLN